MRSSPLERGQQLHAAGQLDAAAACYREAIAADPGDAVAAHYLGVVLMQWQRRPEALALLRGIAASPRVHPDTPTLLAMLCRDMGLYDEGLAACHRVLASRPDDPMANLLAGNLQLLQGDFAAAERHLRRASRTMPRAFETWSYLGMALHRQGKWRDAIAAYRRAADLEPKDHKLQFNIGLCFDGLAEHAAARDAFEQAHRLAPHRADILSRLANVHAMHCDFDGERVCVESLQRLLAAPGDLEPDDQVEPFLLTFLGLDRAAADTVLRRKARQTEEEAAAFMRPVVRVEAAADRPLRIGYISADFGDHAVGTLISQLFHAHDRARVSVNAYSLKRHAGVIADGLRAGADVFRDCDVMSTEQAASAIAGDGIDVLVDMAGYTLGARPAILALRPAPLQVGYLGFLHRYDASWIDAIVVDDVVVPPGAQSSFKEPLIRLPGTMLPAGTDQYEGKADRARFGLPPDDPVFASFNNSYKLDAEVLLAWLEIHCRVPDAWFMVYLPDQAAENVAAFWRRHGGRPERWLFVPKLSAAEHAHRIASCDLFLDAFRYQAGATAVAAAAAGLPVLTRAGGTIVTRLGASLNGFLGLDDLVCPDTPSYIERAVEIGLDRDLRGRIKENLEAAVATSGLLDPRRTAAALETALSRAWQNGAFRT